MSLTTKLLETCGATTDLHEVCAHAYSPSASPALTNKQRCPEHRRVHMAFVPSLRPAQYTAPCPVLSCMDLHNFSEQFQKAFCGSVHRCRGVERDKCTDTYQDQGPFPLPLECTVYDRFSLIARLAVLFLVLIACTALLTFVGRPCRGLARGDFSAKLHSLPD